MRTFLVVALLLTGTVAARAEAPPPYAQRWFYSMTNLQVDKNADELIALIDRAAKAGYNGVVLADYKLNVLGRVPDFYFKNVARVQAAASRAGVEIIPAVFPIGYSAGLLAHDPNLAEGLPVLDAQFVVRQGQAVLDPAAGPRYANGGLEETRGDRFTGFGFQDDPGTVTFADRDTVHSGKVSCRMTNFKKGTTGNSRLTQKVTLRPHACYRFSAWVKSKDVRPAGGFRLLALAPDGRALTFYEQPLPKGDDWAKVSVVFNSLDAREAALYAGLWGGQSGTLWVDDLQLEELGPVNVLHRAGCPFTVKSADGGTTYEEGRDYKPVRDPKLGQVPFAGEFSFDHAAPPIEIVPGSRIPEGARLKVSWYHPILVHGSQVMCCLTEPKVYDLLKDQARRVNDLLKPKTWFFSHDEIRVANWCRACQATGQTPGQQLAANVARCVDIVREASPGAKMVIWSDMFDPHHNAVDRYYLVNGSWKGSWEGLPKTITVANWNGGKMADSLRWFSGRGHSQVLAGYYDEPGLGNFERWTRAARGVPGVTGFMYTTWQHRFDDLDAYGRAMKGR